VKKKKLTAKYAVAHRRLDEGGFVNLRAVFGVVVLFAGLILGLLATANPQVSTLRRGRNFDAQLHPVNEVPFVSPSNVQEEWVARYNGPGNSLDAALAIAVDGSGNSYVAGWSDRNGNFDFDYATIKYNASGTQQWVARYNGPGNGIDRANAIAVDNAGNVYVTGTSWGSGSNYDYATIKYNASGAEEWVVRYNGPGNDYDEATAITVDSSGSVYVTGLSVGSGTLDDYATIKYNASGTEQWVARYNGPGNDTDVAKAIAVDAAGNVYVTGSSIGSGSQQDYATIEYNESGAEEWVARYNGPGNDVDFANAIAIDVSGNVYVTGSSVGSGTDSDYATIKYNASGAEEWVARYNGPGNSIDEGNAIAIDSSGNVYVTGDSGGTGNFNADFATIKYDGSGTEEWVARYNGLGNDTDVATAIAIDNSGNAYVTGHSVGSGTLDDYATIKYNTSGTEEWVARYNGPGDDRDVANAIAIDGSRNVYVTGWSVGSDTDEDYATIKYSQVSRATPTPTASPTVTATSTPTPTATATTTSTPTATVSPTSTPRSAPTPRPHPTPAPRP
jgi:uncharacterized delta-60 repeat protein